MGLHKDQVPTFATYHTVSSIVCDFSPLRVPMGWTADVGRELDQSSIPLVQVLGEATSAYTLGLHKWLLVSYHACKWAEKHISKS